MSSFFEYLEARAADDTRVRATLRRSLAFEPGTYVPAYPYVEPFLGESGTGWRRICFYLIAGLWAAQWDGEAKTAGIPIGIACARYPGVRDSPSMERRFISLLDADEDQLPHRLRQLVALLKAQSLDFGDLLQGLLFWHDDQKRTQNAWARAFYRELGQAQELESPQTEESVS